MFDRFIKKTLISVISLQLIIGNSFLYAETADIQVNKRDNQLINDFLKSSTPSNLPFVDYMEHFYHDKTQLIKRFNLSKYNGRQVYVGYGVFDKYEKYCKYMEQPGLDPTHNAEDKISTFFKNISHFNKHSYAVSINKMSYNKCLELTSHFGGYPAIPDSYAENAFISTKFDSLDSKWLGIVEKNCNEGGGYTNQENMDQDFFNWDSTQPQECLVDKPNVIINNRGYWEKVADNAQHYCVMEVDSQDINRPLKICAPWWRIERDYSVKPKSNWGGVDIYKINQADIPEQMVLCTKIDPNAAKEYIKQSNNTVRQVQCTTYYSSTASEDCLKNPMQPLCFVDECAGYVKNTCKHIDEVTPLKDFTKTQAKIDGHLKWIKGKVNIRTEIYECPPSPPSLVKNCEEQSKVIIYPKECPGSECDALKNCIYNATTPDAKQECYSKYTCQKIYGNPDFPVYDSNGNLLKILGYCKDSHGNNIGEPLEFTPNIEDKISKKCVEYNEINITKQLHQTCTLKRDYADYTVDMSITGKDIYENNPNCIRLNNAITARPDQQLTFTYVNNGFAKLVLRKAFIDSTNIGELFNEQKPYIAAPDEFKELKISSGDKKIKYDTTTLKCDDFTNSWLGDTFNKLKASPVITSSTYAHNAYPFTDSNVMRMTINFTNKSSGCQAEYNTWYENHKNDKDAQFDWNACYDKYCEKEKNKYNGNYKKTIYTDKICFVYYSKRTPDTYFDYIKRLDSNVNNIYVESALPVTKKECYRYASCLGGPYNKNDFKDGLAHICKITAGSSYSAPESDPVIKPVKEDNTQCRPIPTAKSSFQTLFDGSKDIFYIEDVTKGPFGYYTSDTTYPYLSNVVKLDNQEIFPIKDVSKVVDSIDYQGNFIQTSILTKSPNILLGSMVGAASGAALYATIAIMTAGAAIVAAIIIGVLVMVIFGPKKKYNEEHYKWEIYKLVDTNRYVHNIYNYDYRKMVKDKNGNPIIFDGKYYKLIYASFGDSFTGTLEPGDFKTMINNWYKYKETVFKCLGFLSVPHDPMETGVVVGYPSCKWYNWSCNKSNTEKHNPYMVLHKKVTTNYQGAVVTLSIFVPFIGDYVVKAYDKYNNLLGEATVYENQFLGETSNTKSYAQIMFGLNMDLASGIQEGTTSGACRYDLMTEWGGGISGIYYEDNFTGLYHNCDKSNDGYVQDHSAVKITVRPLNEDKPYVIILDAPMPYANRIFLVTNGQKEIRKYRCYDNFGKCDNSDYITDSKDKQ